MAYLMIVSTIPPTLTMPYYEQMKNTIKQTNQQVLQNGRVK